MATKINNVPLSQLTLASHAQCHQEVTALIESLTPEKLHLEALAPQYAAAVTAEQQVVNRPTAYAETADMQQADHVRDLTLSLLFNLVDAYAGSPKDAQQKSAHTLVSLLLPYRGIQTHEMHRQTTETSGLVTALGETSADALYRQVVDTVNAYTLIQPSAEITDFVARMNVIVAKYRNVVANQAKTKKEEK